MPYTVAGYAAHTPGTPLTPFSFYRRASHRDDLVIDILYCGECHSDIHNTRNDWGSAKYPIVPGHEIIGRVQSVGSNVTRFKAGDKVGVGCMVGSCQHCECVPCRPRTVLRKRRHHTYNAIDRQDGAPTFGGYSDSIVVNEKPVLRVPDGLDLAGAALLPAPGSPHGRRRATGKWDPVARWLSLASAAWSTWC